MVRNLIIMSLELPMRGQLLIHWSTLLMIGMRHNLPRLLAMKRIMIILQDVLIIIKMFSIRKRNMSGRNIVMERGCRILNLLIKMSILPVGRGWALDL